jgi:hypothetical protein
LAVPSTQAVNATTSATRPLARGASSSTGSGANHVNAGIGAGPVPR